MDKGKEPLQAAVPPPPETEPELQLTWTAETGMLEQPTKVADPACTPTVQCWRCEPRRTVQVTLPDEEPDTVPEFGLAAEKLIVPGVAESAAMVAKARRDTGALTGPMRKVPAWAPLVPQTNTAVRTKILPGMFF